MKISPLRVFEGFAGAGGGHLALSRSSLNAEVVAKSEIDKQANEVYDSHFANVLNLGDMDTFSAREVPDIDMVIGGPPCTQLTKLCLAGKEGDVRANLAGKDSRLFWNIVEIIKVKKPKYFLIENVATMTPLIRDQISEVLGVEPIKINSSLVSAQSRERYYWCNWETWQPNDRGILLQDIKIRDSFKYAYAWSKSTRRPKVINEGTPEEELIPRSYDERLRKDGKSHTLTGRIHGYESVNFFTKKKLNFKKRKVFSRDDLLMRELKKDLDYRHCNMTELERLQTFPDGWTRNVSNAAAVRLMGKAFTVEVIVHLLNCLAHKFRINRRDYDWPNQRDKDC